MGEAPLMHWYMGINKKIYVDSYWIHPGHLRAPLVNWTCTEALDDGKWHHLTLTMDEGDYTLYVDGENLGKIGSNALVYNLSQPFPAAPPYFQIGKAQPEFLGSDHMQGDVDRLRVYDRKLNTAEVLALYQTDIDGDGLFDWFENKYRSDRVTFFDMAGLDEDRDGLTTEQEQTLDLDPRNFDTDGDLLPDGFEQMYGLDAKDTSSPNGTLDDPDGDGLVNIDELIYGSDPNKKDTDGDGVDDDVEAAQGSYPNDASDNGQAPSPEETMELRLSVGDPSDSHSERYYLEARDLETDKVIISHQARTFGVVTSGTYKQFRKGKSYAFSIHHAGTKPGQAEPDYDYFSEVVFVNPDDEAGYSKVDPYDPATKSKATPANGHKVMEDSRDGQNQPVGTGNGEVTDFKETIEKYEALHLIPQVGVDNNRDGEITFDGKDLTTEANPYVFWINNDSDKGHTVDFNDWEEDDLENGNDATEPGLHSRRDLEDLSRIWIDLSPLQKVYGKDLIGVGLSVTMTGDQEINLFLPVEEDGGKQYLQDENVGWNQYQGIYKDEHVSSVRKTAWLAVDFRNSLTEEGHFHLLFEGQKAGQGKLWFKVSKFGDTIAYSRPINLDLKDVTEMYETWSVGDVADVGVQFKNTFPASSATQTGGQNLPVPETLEDKDYILFVHGWNMEAWDKTAFASTMFKRLWHQGYKGRFGAFRWPTFYGFPSVNINALSHFDGSEERAWNSGTPFVGLLNNLSVTFKDNNGNSLVRCYAHSMGNIVVSEALRQMTPNGKVHTYISAQAELSAHVWDSTRPNMAYTPTTPNVYAYYWQNGTTSPPGDWAAEQKPSYMAPQYMPPLVKFINHYNAEDWALTGLKWENNQKLKPDVGYHYGKTLLNQVDHFYEQKVAPTTQDLNFPGDRFEIFSYAAESRAFATGADGTTAGKFNVADSVDLDAEFDFGEAHKGHSAQFRSFIQKRWTYWEQALDDMAIATP